MNSLDTSEIETGDIFLLSGILKPSISIQIGTKSKYNHCGIAVWLKTNEVYSMLGSNGDSVRLPGVVDNTIGSELYIFESSSGASYDILTKKDMFGCRLVKFSEIIKYYDHVVIRKVNVTRDNIFYEKLKTFILSYKEVGYDTSPFNLTLAPLGVSVVNDSTEVFCSELVALYLYYIGMIPEYRKATYPTRYFLPKDYSGTSEKIPTGVLGAELVVFSTDDEFLSRYGILILLIVTLIFLIIIRVSM
jgi:hypothetical protein